MRPEVLIDGRLIGYRHGGIANYARHISSHGVELARGFDVRVATRHFVPALSDFSVRAFTPPHHRFERFAFGAEVMVRQPALLHSVDFVHPILWGISHVVTVHDLAFLDNPSLVTSEARDYYSIVRSTLGYADRVIAVSNWTRERILFHIEIDPARVVVVPNGYDAALFGPTEIDDRPLLSRLHPSLNEVLRTARPAVLAVGTIEPRKRFDVVLEAFDRYASVIKCHAGETPVLILVGQNGWLSENLVPRLRRLHQAGRTIWLRDVNDHELAALYRLAELLVMPSADEGFGLPVLEAMASGTPSLVSANGNLPALVGDCGFVEETDDPCRWADKIGRILADSEIRRTRGRKGIVRSAPFTWQETARRTIDVYRELLNE